MGDYQKKGKEYVNEILRYEGEYYKDRKWSGKGYDEKGNIIYELINGNGKIKEFNEKGKLIFEGEYLNEERNGKGKEFDFLDGYLVFEGEYLNGERNGNGKEYDDKGKLDFEGEYQNGRRWNGKGKEYDSDTGLEYEVGYLYGEKRKI